jgi:hypothetical protein
MAKDQMCNFGNCLRSCEQGVVVTLRKPDEYGRVRAVFCSATHASASLRRLGKDRRELQEDPPLDWKTD